MSGIPGIPTEDPVSRFAIREPERLFQCSLHLNLPLGQTRREPVAIFQGTEPGVFAKRMGEMALIIEPAIQCDLSHRFAPIFQLPAGHVKPDPEDVIAWSHLKQTPEFPL